MVLAWLQKCTPDYLKLSEVSTIPTFSNRKWIGFVLDFWLWPTLLKQQTNNVLENIKANYFVTACLVMVQVTSTTWSEARRSPSTTSPCPSAAAAGRCPASGPDRPIRTRHPVTWPQCSSLIGQVLLLLAHLWPGGHRHHGGHLPLPGREVRHRQPRRRRGGRECNQHCIIKLNWIDRF